MLKDMAEGMRHIQETQGMIHFDFKPPNCLIDGDGNVKIADFGTTVEGEDIAFIEASLIDNPSWQAPELLHAKDKVSGLEGLKDKTVKQSGKLIVERLKDTFPDATPKEINVMAQSLLRPVTENLKSEIKVTNKIDSWSLGISGINIFTGNDFLPEAGFMTEIINAVKDFGTDRQNVALGTVGENGKLPDNVFAEETGFTGVDSFINSMLSPNPEDRPSLTEALENPVFIYPGVGSKAARDLLLALQSNDTTKIDTAKNALEHIIRPLPPPPPQSSQPIPPPPPLTNRPLPQTPPRQNRPLPTPPGQTN
jgi:serine/threonine protein kinase